MLQVNWTRRDIEVIDKKKQKMRFKKHSNQKGTTYDATWNSANAIKKTNLEIV